MSFISYLRGFAYYALSVAPVVLAIDHGVASVAYVQGRSMTPTLNGGDPTIYKNLGKMGMKSKTNSFPETNELLLIRKLMYKPARGDVVVLDSPGKPGQRVVKRLIAMEGDIIIYYAPGRVKPLSTLQSEIEAEQKLAELSEAMPHNHDLQELLEELTQQFKMKQNEERQIPVEHISNSNKDLPDSNDNNFNKTDSTPHFNIKYHEFKPDDKEFKFEDAELRIIRIPMGHCWVEGDNQKFSRDSRDYGPVPIAMVCGGVDCIIWPPRLAGILHPRKGSTNIIYIQTLSYKNQLNLTIII